MSGNHKWHDYKGEVEKLLKELTKKTGITDWKSKEGQRILIAFNESNREVNALDRITRNDSYDIY